MSAAVLALDTSTPLASVALQVGDRIFERAERVATYSERLLVLIDELFTEAGCSARDLVGVAVGAGPGSFTGLRIGLGTAKGLCLGANAPLVMISSLEVLAARAPAGSTVVAALDAFRGEVYVGLFDVDGQGIPRARSPALAAFAILPAHLSSTIASHGGAQAVIGDGFSKYPAAISDGATVLEGAGPRACELLKLARPRFAAGTLDDLRTAVPHYVRASAPEEDKKPKLPIGAFAHRTEAHMAFSLTDEQIEKLRQSGIRLDAEGRFWHEGAEVTHHGMKAAFYRWVDRNPDGRWVLRLDEKRFVYLEVDDAPYAITSLRLEGRRIFVHLSDDTDDELAYDTVKLRAGKAYALVKNGRWEARLSNTAWGALGEAIEEKDGAPQLRTPSGWRRLSE